MIITDEMLAAYVDGELDSGARHEIDAALTQDAGLRARLAQEQDLRARLSRHFAPIADEPIPDRFTQLLRAQGTDNVVSFAEAQQKRARRFSSPAWGNVAAIAATLVLGVAIGHYHTASIGGDVVTQNGQLVAQGALAKALNTQLAANQTPQMPVHIGVSFRNQNDQLCRTFNEAALSGIACRGVVGWTLPHTTTAPSSVEAATYRQAGSADPALMQAAQAMMKGAPLDAAAENQALSNHLW